MVRRSRNNIPFMTNTNNPSDVANLVNKDDLKRTIDRFDYILIAVIGVIVMGFITLLVTVCGLVIDNHRFKAETYQNLINKIDNQNTKIENLIQKESNKTIIGPPNPKYLK